MPAPQRAWPDGPRVFLIEDDEDSRAMYSEYLTSFAGMRVIDRAPCATTVEDVAAAAPDVVVTDYIMPGMDGVTLCQQLRDNPETRCIPVIMITADAPAAQSDALRRVCVAVLLKPCEPGQLAIEILAAAGQTLLPQSA